MRDKYANRTTEEALLNAIINFHRWDDMIFQGKDGRPPLVDVDLQASTVEMFIRETELLKTFFQEKPYNGWRTNTNIATILYKDTVEGPKLMGMAVEYGDKEIAYHTMERLDIGKLDKILKARNLDRMPDWRFETEVHADVMREFIREETKSKKCPNGVEAGLVKVADLDGFFGRMVDVFARGCMLSMFLYAGRTAIDVVSKRHLSIHPKPMFFNYLEKAEFLAPALTSEALEDIVWKAIPSMKMGVVVECSTGHACLEIDIDKLRYPSGNQKNALIVNDMTDEMKIWSGKGKTHLRDVTRNFYHDAQVDFALGISMARVHPMMKAVFNGSGKSLAWNMYKLLRNYGNEIAFYPEGNSLSPEKIKAAAMNLATGYAKDFVEMPARRMAYSKASEVMPKVYALTSSLVPNKWK